MAKGSSGWMPWQNYMKPALYLAIWTSASSVLIIMNKRLLVDHGFNFPLALTGAGQSASFLLGLLVAQSGLVPLRAGPGPSFFFSRLMPIVACSAGTLFFGNIAYLHLSVAFIQILKAATPAFTLTLCAILGLEKPTVALRVSVILIVVGTSIATLVESRSGKSGGGEFSWLGFGYLTFSACLEAVRVVYIQLLLGSLDYSAVDVLVYLAPPTAVLLFMAAAIFERDGLKSQGFSLIAERPLAYLAAALMGFVVNLSTAKAIQATSSLTFKVLGCLKNSAVIACGVLLGDQISVWQLLGYGISTFGFVLFSRAKLLQDRQQKGSLKQN